MLNGTTTAPSLLRTNEMAAIGALEGLTSLEELNFNNIKGLTGIPAYVAQLPLKELSLCYCPVTSLPPSSAVRGSAALQSPPNTAVAHLF